ncbi:MAG: hypothetical protein FP825_05695 [Hyphomonas sp.]|uniref:queuosine salvage family protein n=1 Tax=Hyphomonas sp. TaxID=87 RepID=UPI001800A08A|nr:queuosine salvage family protein [Hyphomonas sp.]MBA3067960.1 hypothetical protein [Hyphomonas sp.]MBU3919369.1 queuosine salvage family protein [Alphaproteobacteria bacterium]MBU4061298.1 queuosine salvage family protein [Alphaproteobacteria bacterium]MBU4162551.1 queuosine salvage family protein [Alphaproteobacteria bacterium]
MTQPAGHGRLGDVLPSCFRATEASRLVRIDTSRLSHVAGSLAAALPSTMRHTPHHLLGEPEETVAYFLVLDTLNFGSGFFGHLAPYRGEQGYYAVATALRDWIVRDGVPSPDVLKAMRPGQVSDILGQTADPALAQLTIWFADALRELGRFTDEVLGGRFRNILSVSDHTASGMVAQLCRMPMFRDKALLDGREVSFLKRAQICVQDIAIAASEDGLAALHIQELDRLTVFADNMLPFILEAEGILVYADDLSTRIEAGEDLHMGSRAETELRANSIVACELLRQELQRKGISVTAREIDFALWNQGDRQSASSPRRLHVCRSYFY